MKNTHKLHNGDLSHQLAQRYPKFWLKIDHLQNHNQMFTIKKRREGILKNGKA